MQNDFNHNENDVLLVQDEVTQKSIELLDKFGLNWDVQKENLISERTGWTTGSAGIFRTDTNAWLGTVSPKYTPYQNIELVKTIVEASEHIGLDLTNAGVLNGGKQVYVQLEMPQVFIGKSMVKRQITALNHHNGLGSIAFGSSNVVVACSNKFYKAYKELEKFRHNSSAAERVKTAVMELKNTIQEDLRLMESFQLMAATPGSDELTHKVVLNVFQLDLDEDLSSKPRQLAKRNTIINALETEQKLEGNSLWGLFNGITRLTNHHSTRAKSTDDYVMTGDGYVKNLKAYGLIENWFN